MWFPLWPFWSVKYLNFGYQFRSSIQITNSTHHTFLKSRHPEVSKSPYYVLSPKWSQKKYQLMDYEFHKKYPVFSEKIKQSLPKVIIKLPIRSYFLVQASQNVTKDVFSFIFRFSKKNIWCVLKIIFKCHGELKTCPQTSFLKNKIVTTENMLKNFNPILNGRNGVGVFLKLPSFYKRFF